MSLRILEYLDNIEEFNGVAISAKLCCTCGDCFFTKNTAEKDTFSAVFFYPLRKQWHIISPFGAVSHHAPACIFLRLDDIQHFVLMIYRNKLRMICKATP